MAEPDHGNWFNFCPECLPKGRLAILLALLVGLTVGGPRCDIKWNRTAPLAPPAGEAGR